MKLGIVKEQQGGETRVAASPETVRKYAGLGFEVMVEQGAGRGAAFPDDAYREAGARLVSSAREALESADVVLKVRRPLEEELGYIRRGATLIGLLAPFEEPAFVEKYAAQDITAFALELLPRITRAQSMDALSSQSNLAGYKAVIDAAATFGRAFPMMMTAAGTVAPARVFVMGAGVAGLQAIATAKRLGAIVSATDVRRAAKEQVESLAADFVMVEPEEGESGETEGGYAKEMSESYQRRQADLIAETVKKQEIIICTALIPGRLAPTLVTEEMVVSMKPGSVIVDLAVEQGGNCALSKSGEVVETDNGVTIIGHLNMPGRLAADTSALYARNLLNFVSLVVDQEAGRLSFNWEDQILSGSVLTREGKVVHPSFAPGESS